QSRPSPPSSPAARPGTVRAHRHDDRRASSRTQAFERVYWLVASSGFSVRVRSRLNHAIASNEFFGGGGFCPSPLERPQPRPQSLSGFGNVMKLAHGLTMSRIAACSHPVSDKGKSLCACVLAWSGWEASGLLP